MTRQEYRATLRKTTKVIKRMIVRIESDTRIINKLRKQIAELKNDKIRTE